ncbi:hypothetical protein KP509_02G098500 [Ceratopteris richardii]|uniref:RRM domain-containing protein n=1 Tax=Ceratopteris richardii TaxID=49495 RepID=A0A8T2VD06_CERRI|nr:hypothetical protein KP509_02G098500 [Ceratopteris richardii]
MQGTLDASDSGVDHLEQMAMVQSSETTTSPLLDLPTSASELRVRALSTEEIVSQLSTSTAHADPSGGVECLKSPRSIEPQNQGLKSQLDSSAASLDANALEFFPTSLYSTPNAHKCFPVKLMESLKHRHANSCDQMATNPNVVTKESLLNSQDVHESSDTSYVLPRVSDHRQTFVSEVHFFGNHVASERSGYGCFHERAIHLGFPVASPGTFALPPPTIQHTSHSPVFHPIVKMLPSQPTLAPLIAAPVQMLPGCTPKVPHQVIGLVDDQQRSSSRSLRRSLSCYSHGIWKEHVSRTLLIVGLPGHISETHVRRELECWGAIRGIQLDVHEQCLQVQVQFYDLRSAREALQGMRSQFVAHHTRHYSHLWEGGFLRTGILCGVLVAVQYTSSWGMAVPDAQNQGTLVLFNVGSEVNVQDIRCIFEAYGNVREVREAPTKRQHKFVEFYDVRAAAAAWLALNGKEICGKYVKIEFSRQGGAMSRLQMGTKDKACQETLNPSLCVNYCTWNGHGFYGFNPYWTNTQLVQGSDVYAHAQGVSMHSPMDFCLAGDPCSLTMTIHPEMGSREDDTGRRANREGVASGIRVLQTYGPGAAAPQPYCSGGPFKDRNVAAPRFSKSHTNFQFNEVDMYVDQNKPRTTLMIQNIPNKYSQKMLLSTLDQYCLEANNNLGVGDPEAAYDFMYLPIDFKNKCNLGYAFVNFTSPQATHGFYKAFHSKAWEEFNSRKICEITFARLQGRMALEDHFKNSRFACDTEEYLPVLFVPPRNGANGSQPIVAVGQMGVCHDGLLSRSKGQFVSPGSIIHEEQGISQSGGENGEGSISRSSGHALETNESN